MSNLKTKKIKNISMLNKNNSIETTTKNDVVASASASILEKECTYLALPTGLGFTAMLLKS